MFINLNAIADFVKTCQVQYYGRRLDDWTVFHAPLLKVLFQTELNHQEDRVGKETDLGVSE